MGSMYSSLQFQLWATVNGTAVDLVQFNCTYEMNTIPRCQAMLPVGYKVLPPHMPATTHAVTQGVQVQIPLKVYCTVTYCSGWLLPSLPNTGTYTLFDGYVTGVGYRRTYDGYSMTIEGTHWLSNLGYSSIMSETSSPMNPTQFSFNAALTQGGGILHCLPVTEVLALATPQNVKTDLWGNVLQPWFLNLAAKNRINRRLLSNLDVNPNNDTKNSDCSQALNRISGEELPFDIAGFRNGASIAAMIGKDLACIQQPNVAADRMAHQTFWDKIVGEVSPTYMFSLIPFPKEAKVVPFIPGLRDFWDPAGEGFTFRGRDIEVQDMSCHLPRQLRALCIFAGMNMRAGTNIGASTINNYRVGGAYVGADTGLIMMREAPSFLWDAKLVHRFTGHITKLRGNAFNHPGAGDAPEGPKPDEIAKDAYNLLDDVAHAWYVAEVLKNRYGDISTAVRFDVAPGSSVKVEGTSGMFMADGEPRYAQVTRVSHQFDAQQQQCRSNFRLVNMHTQAEHEQDQFTTTSHPLYTTTWPGAKHMTAE